MRGVCVLDRGRERERESQERSSARRRGDVDAVGGASGRPSGGG